MASLRQSLDSSRCPARPCANAQLHWLYPEPVLANKLRPLLSAPVSLPLSVVIVAKNEAANLPRCLASVRGWTAGVVVAIITFASLMSLRRVLLLEPAVVFRG